MTEINGNGIRSLTQFCDCNCYLSTTTSTLFAIKLNTNKKKVMNIILYAISPSSHNFPLLSKVPRRGLEIGHDRVDIETSRNRFDTLGIISSPARSVPHAFK